MIFSDSRLSYYYGGPGRPRLQTIPLQDEAGAEVETLAIDKWDTDEVREYLDSQVQM